MTVQECDTHVAVDTRAQVRKPIAMCEAAHARDVAHILWPSRLLECETFAGTTRPSHSICGSLDCSMDARGVLKCFFDEWPKLRHLHAQLHRASFTQRSVQTQGRVRMAVRADRGRHNVSVRASLVNRDVPDLHQSVRSLITWMGLWRRRWLSVATCVSHQPHRLTPPCLTTSDAASPLWIVTVTLKSRVLDSACTFR